MAKEKAVGKRQRREYTEEQKAELKELQQKAREIKNRGSFNGYYDHLRKESIAIRYSKDTESKKKDALRELMDSITQEMDDINQ